MKKVRVKNEMDDLAAAEAAVLGADDDDDDDDDEDAMEVDAKVVTKGTLAEEDDEDSEGTFLPLSLSDERTS
jgi:structure-specific recognition protein 1